jgi:hypothetical protein
MHPSTAASSTVTAVKLAACQFIARKTRRSFTSYSRQPLEAGRRWFTGIPPLAVCVTLSPPMYRGAENWVDVQDVADEHFSVRLGAIYIDVHTIATLLTSIQTAIRF